MEKQLKLKFKGHPVIDPSFKRYTVVIFKNQFDKDGIWVPDIWAKNQKQAIVKAAKKVRMRKCSIKESLAKAQKP